jgi:hypothetical protein
MIIDGTFNLVASELWKSLQLQEVRLECDTSAGPVTINLFAIADIKRFYNVKIYVSDLSHNAGTNPIRIGAAPGDTIDGAGNTQLILNEDGVSAKFEIARETQWIGFESVGGGLDTNTWNVPGVAFVDPVNGTAAGVVGDGNKPFQTLAQAFAASGRVIALPGNYFGTHTVPAGTYSIDFYDGAILPSGSRLRDGGNTVNLTVTGKLEVGAFSYGFEFAGIGSVANIEMKQFTGSRQFVMCFSAGQDVYLKADLMDTNNFNGAGYACTVRAGSKLVIETNRCLMNYWLVAPNGIGNTFIFKCPDVTTRNGGFYGNGFKSLLNLQGSVTSQNTIIFDFMGGTYDCQQLVQGSSFGVADSALQLVVNCFAASNNNVTFKNGTADAGNLFGWLLFYIILDGTFSVENLKLKSNTSAFSTFHGNTAAGGIATVNVENSHLESVNFIGNIGNSRVMNFVNSTFKVTGVDTKVFNFNNSNPTTPPSFYFTNCSMQLATAGIGHETFLGMTAPVTLGCVNTYSSANLGVGAVDTWAGFLTIPTLQVPNI